MRTIQIQRRNYRIIKVFAIFFCCAFTLLLSSNGQSIMIGGQGGVSFVDTPQVIVKQNARYQLWQGVDVAIKTVLNLGEAPTLQRVLSELEEMQRLNDVKLPYEYSFSGKVSFRTKGNGNTRMRGNSVNRTLTPKNKKRKDDFERKVAIRLADVLSRSPQYAKDVASLVPQEPTPGMFSKKEDFVKAYTAYKLQRVDDEVKVAYAKKIGGLGDYKRDMQREASDMWNHQKGR